MPGREFTPMNNGARYGVDATAECSLDRQHLAPHPGCTCGFYANKGTRPARASENPGYLTLEVELFGKVLVHTNGYRAERQRVLAVYAPRGYLRSRGCTAKIASVGLSAPQMIGTTSFVTNANPIPVVAECGHLATWEDAYGTMLCTHHVLSWHHKFSPLAETTPDLGGVEWHWV